jgi:nicotinamidase-related amidase
VLLIVIDPQKAFTHPAGSLARAFGVDEIQPCRAAAERLRVMLGGAIPRQVDTLLVRSEYRPGQFTGGILDRPLATLCVPGSLDCQLADGLESWWPTFTAVKHGVDALGSSEYSAVVSQAVRHGVRTFWFAGFLLTSCVRETALSTHQAHRASRVRSHIVTPLTGARRSSFEPQSDGLSRVETVEAELARAGIAIARTMSALSDRGTGRIRPGFQNIRYAT